MCHAVVEPSTTCCWRSMGMAKAPTVTTMSTMIGFVPKRRPPFHSHNGKQSTSRTLIDLPVSPGVTHSSISQAATEEAPLRFLLPSAPIDDQDVVAGHCTKNKGIYQDDICHFVMQILVRRRRCEHTNRSVENTRSR